MSPQAGEMRPGSGRLSPGFLTLSPLFEGWSPVACSPVQFAAFATLLSLPQPQKPPLGDGLDPTRGARKLGCFRPPSSIALPGS